MRRTFLLALLAISLCALSAPAATRKELSDRAASEWKKFEERGTNVCFGSGSLYFVYTPLDRREWTPVVFSPTLPTDLLKNVASAFRFNDANAQKLIAEDVNAALNEHIEELRNGTYNRIDVFLGHGTDFTITPAQSGGEDVLIWIIRGFADRLLDIADHQMPRDFVVLLKADGTLHRVGTDAPKWLESRNQSTQTGGNLRSERRRQKNYVQCK
jgi:hypothetical protein